MECGVEPGDQPDDFPERIAVGVGSLGASGLAVVVAADDSPLLVAACADGRRVPRLRPEVGLACVATVVSVHHADCPMMSRTPAEPPDQ